MRVRDVTAYPRVGGEVAGYRIERLLGRGGMSVVYLAEDTRLGRKVALKLLAPELAEDERFRERFLRESKLAASIDHSNVIPIYEAGEADGLLFIAMRYVEGTDLKELLAEEGKLDPARAIALASQIAEALDTAHQHGLVHRDVKPANVLITKHGGREHCYLADFGLTKQSGSDTGLTATDQFVGTPDYVAPELIEREPADGRADQYSLACVLFECLTGEAPYRGESLMGTLWAHVNDPPPTVSALRSELPPETDAALARGMAKNPADRYPTCHELVEAARDALGVGAVTPAKRTRTRAVVLLLLALALVLLATAAAAGVLLIGGDGQAAKPLAVSVQPTLAPDVDSVQHIDPATNTLVATVGVGRDPGGVAVAENAVWVTSELESTISRIDPDTGAVSKTVPLGNRPYDVVAADRHLWVVDQDALLYVLDPQSLALVATLPTQQTGDPAFLAGSEAALWATLRCRCGTGGLILPFGDIHGGVIRLGFGGLSPRVDVIKVPHASTTGIAVGEDAVWVPNDYGGLAELQRFDPEAMTLAATIPLDGGSAGIAVGAGAVWVANPLGDTVSQVDPATDRVADRIVVGDTPLAVAYGDGSVWVANRADGTVSRIDPATNAVVTTIDVGPSPDHIAVGTSGVWVTVHAA